MNPSKVILSAILPCINLLSLLLLLLLRSAFSLLLESLILMLDLRCPSLGFSATASTINYQLYRNLLQKAYPHVNSTLILLAGDFPSSNDEW